jgi:selenocysteine lyase/cysteine desulfurase
MVLNNTDVSSGFLTVWRRDPATGAEVQLRLPVGSVRVSLGFLSTFDDVYAFVAFLRTTYLSAGQGGGEGQAGAAATLQGLHS